MVKHKKIIILSVSIMLFIVVGAFAGIILRYKVIASNNKTLNITLSPDKNYSVAYNKSTKTVEIIGLNSGYKGYKSPSGWVPADDPVFCWSPDSRFLAITYSDARGYKWTHLTDLLYNSGVFSIPMKSEIQDSYEETRTEDKYNNQNAFVYISEWLDNTRALVKFSWPSDVSDKFISGWYICDVPERSIVHLYVI